MLGRRSRLHIPPRVSVAYAPREIRAGSVDAVVANITDNHRVARTDLLIDDQPQHLDETPRYGLGPVLLPLLTRDLKPGLHRLQVIAHDDAGNQGSSPEALFTVSATAAASGKYERAVFLLNRFGYGPEPAEIAAILTMGEQKWLESRLAQGIPSPAEENEREILRAQFSNERDAGQVTSGAISYLLAAPNPVRARLLMWTENHFSTWITKDRPSAKARLRGTLQHRRSLWSSRLLAHEHRGEHLLERPAVHRRLYRRLGHERGVRRACEREEP